MVFNGKEQSQKILADLKNRISLLGFVPEFSDILVGQDGPSTRYVNMKKNMAENLGINFISGDLPVSSSTLDVINKIKELSQRPNICGIIVQLPLPDHINTEDVLNAVPISLDVDGLSFEYSENFYSTLNHSGMCILPTVNAVNKILNQAIHDNLNVKNFAIVGQGRLVGKPITHLLKSQSELLDLGWEIKTIDIDTPYFNREQILKEADVIISAVGSPDIITGDQVKDSVIIIDAGTLEVGNTLVGDIEFESIKEKASFITPTPGGVGPMTVACLMENVVVNAENKYV